MARYNFHVIIALLFTFIQRDAVGFEGLALHHKSAIDRQIGPAYESGDFTKVFESIHRLIHDFKIQDISAIDEYLADRDSPSLGTMLLEARLKSAASGGEFAEPKPRPIEVLLILPEIREAAEASREKVQSLPVMAESPPVPKNLQGYAEMFRAIEQAGTLAYNSTELAHHATRFVRLARFRRSSLSDTHRATLEADYDKLVSDLETLEQKTKEREIELRLQRLAQAIAILDISRNAKDRLRAAHSIDLDGSQLTEFFKQRAKSTKGESTSSRLNDPNLAEATREDIEYGRELAGDLIDKSRMLYGGMYWWLRGRYGRGPLFYGLVKSHEASRSEAARIPLYMPDEFPKNDTVSQYEYPDRRHYYTWFWEERTLQVRTNSNTKSLKPIPKNYAPVTFTVKRTMFQPMRGTRGVSRHGGGFSGTRRGGAPMAMQFTRADLFGKVATLAWGVPHIYRQAGSAGKNYANRPKYKPQTPPKPYPKPDPSYETTTYIETFINDQDPYLVYRIVGYVEYMRALEFLDGLARYCNSEELKAIDELLQERAEFIVETNLSRKIEHQPSQMDLMPDKAGDDFRRHGLSWMAGLARAELTAMLVGFAAQDDAFTRLAMPYDHDAYKEIVRDGMRSHYWSLQNDASLQQVLRGDTDATVTLAFMRRRIVAEGFLKAAVALGPDDFNPAQKAELVSWKTNLDKLQAVLHQRLADFHTQEVKVEQR